MEIKIREAKRSDIAALKDALREADREEVLAAGNPSAEAALTQSYERSTLCLCVDIDGHPAALFGVVPDCLLGTSASVWFLGSNEMSRIKKAFVRLSRVMIREFLAMYPILWNDVDSRYTSAVRWLKSNGAHFFPTPVRYNGVDFLRFVIRRA